MDEASLHSLGIDPSDLPKTGLQLSYSQFGEDVVLEALLKNNKRIDSGFYVDIGAFHPWVYSNTALLRLAYGWRGINVDASRETLRLFNEERPDDTNIQALVGTGGETRTYMKFNHGAVNTADPAMLKLQTRPGSPFEVLDQEEMRVVGLDELLETHLPPDVSITLLSVDVEGMDLDVLASNDWLKYRPFIIAVEAHGMDLYRSTANPTSTFLQNLGYHLVAHTFATSIFIDRSTRGDL
jgi:FkbM family methyltransferase